MSDDNVDSVADVAPLLGRQHSQGVTYTVDEAIDHIGLGKFQLKLLFIVGCCWAADAMEMLLLSYLTAIAGCVWKLTPVEEATIVTVVFVGMAIGASVWGRFGDMYGRRLTYLLTGGLTAFMGLASAFSPSYGWLLITRGLTGVGIGGLHVAYTLFSEYLPSDNRAVILLSLVMFWAIGCIFEAVVAWVTLPTLGWRWMLAVSSMPMFICLLFYPMLPESARYYVIADDLPQARLALEEAARANETSLPPGHLVIESVKEQVSPEDMARKESLWYLLDEESHLRYTTLLVWLLWFIASFVYYGMILSITEILSDDMLGKRCHRPLQPKGKPGHHKADCNRDLFTTADYMDVFFTSVAEIPGVLIAGVMLYSSGRRTAMASMFAASSAALFLLLLCFGRSFETVLLAASKALMLGGWQGLYVYTPEIYPTFIRATGMGIASAMARFAGMTTPFVAQVLAKKNVNFVFLIYGGSAALAVFLVSQLGVETRGRIMPDTHEDVCKIPYHSCSACTAARQKREKTF